MDEKRSHQWTRHRLGLAAAALTLFGAAGRDTWAACSEQKQRKNAEATLATPVPTHTRRCGGERCPDQPPEFVLITTDDMNASDDDALPHTRGLLAELDTTCSAYGVVCAILSPWTNPIGNCGDARMKYPPDVHTLRYGYHRFASVPIGKNDRGRFAF